MSSLRKGENEWKFFLIGCPPCGFMCGSLGGHQMLPRFVLMGKTLSKLRIVQGWNYQQLLLNHGLEAMILAILVIFYRKVQTGVSQLPTDSLPDQPEDYLSMSIQVLALPISVHQMRETRYGMVLGTI